MSDKSAKMTFTGTVAWMAPEVIRNDPCSEKVDIWLVTSFTYAFPTGQPKFLLRVTIDTTKSINRSTRAKHRYESTDRLEI